MGASCKGRRQADEPAGHLPASVNSPTKQRAEWSIGCKGNEGTRTPPEAKVRHLQRTRKLTLCTLTSWHPNHLEIALVTRINTMRARPEKFLSVITKRIGKLEQKATDVPAELKELRDHMRRQKPVPRLRMSFVLSQAAKMQCDNLCSIETKAAANELVNRYHKLDRISMHRRLSSIGVPHGKSSDIVEFGGKSATDILVRLLTAGDAETRLRHREALFNKSYQYVGLAECTHHRIGKLCCISFSQRPAKKGAKSMEEHSVKNDAKSETDHTNSLASDESEGYEHYGVLANDTLEDVGYSPISFEHPGSTVYKTIE